MSLKINNDTANGSVTLRPKNVSSGDVVATLPEFSCELAPRMTQTTSFIMSGLTFKDVPVPSWVKKITVCINNIGTNGSSPKMIQLGTSSGIQTSLYYGSASGCSTAVASLAMSSGFILENASNPAYSIIGSCTICNLDGNNFVENSMCGSLGEVSTRFSGGITSLSGLLTTVRITTLNGTDIYDSGTFSLLFEG